MAARAMARRLCRCKAYAEEFAAYVRPRTEPVKLEGDNCSHARPPPVTGSRQSHWPNTVRGSIRLRSDSGRFEFNHERIVNMLYTIAVVLIVLWLLGVVTSVTMGGFVHVLLVIAFVVVLLRIIGGRRPI